MCRIQHEQVGTRDALAELLRTLERSGGILRTRDHKRGSTDTRQGAAQIGIAQRSAGGRVACRLGATHEFENALYTLGLRGPERCGEPALWYRFDQWSKTLAQGDSASLIPHRRGRKMRGSVREHQPLHPSGEVDRCLQRDDATERHAAPMRPLNVQRIEYLDDIGGQVTDRELDLATPR